MSDTTNTAVKSKILIVDDERLNITVLADLLHEDYNIVVAKNGQQALDRVFCDAPPDLILLDVMMPDMDGYDVCRAIKADKKSDHIPIIFITALSSEADESKGFDVGGVDFVSKPFRPVVVKARIKMHLELKRRGDLLAQLATLDGINRHS